VIFGCGYVGTAVAGRRRRRGIRVEALTRNPDRAAALVELGAAAVVAISRRIPGTSASRRARSFVLNCVSSEAGELQSTAILCWRDAIDSRLGGAQCPEGTSSTPAAHRCTPDRRHGRRRDCPN